MMGRGADRSAPRAADPLAQGGLIYDGEVMHLRLSPHRHQFRYRVWTLLLDLDRIDEVAGRLRLMARNRFAPVSFHDRDHGARDGSDLRAWVEARLRDAGRPAPARIWLLAMPRLFGVAFNPLSVFYCRDAAGRLQSVIYEVKNTFGDQHAYVLSAETAAGEGAGQSAGEAAGAPAMVRHSHAKQFFVSPFMDMDQTYRFDLSDPGARIALRIRQGAGSETRLIATQNGAARALTDGALARLAMGRPLHALKVLAGIHWEALRLWIKGVPFLGHPGDAHVYAPGVRPPQA
jgi:hypothetical protein